MARDAFSKNTDYIVFAPRRSCRSLWGEGRGGWIDLFSGEGDGFETESVTNTKATTDQNYPFLNMGFKHGIKWVDKNAAKCNIWSSGVLRKICLCLHAQGIA